MNEWESDAKAVGCHALGVIVVHSVYILTYTPSSSYRSD